MSNSKTVTFGIRVNADTNAAEGAKDVDSLRKSIEGAQAQVKAYESSLRKLRGGSEEVSEAKKRLKGAIAAEKDEISRNVLALGKMGATVRSANDATRGFTQSTKELREAIAAGRDATGGFSSAMSGLDAVAKGSTAGIIGAAVGVGLLALSLEGKLVGAAFDAAAALVKFDVEGANTIRTYEIAREAALGSGEAAIAYGHQIDSVSSKVVTSRKELEALAVEQSILLKNTRVSGQGMVDIFEATSEAASGLGQNAGKKLEEILTRGRNIGLMGLRFQGIFGADELQGTGITTGNVAQQLAKNLGISIRQAQIMLASGRVKIDDGAKAIKQVVEQRFGEINARKLLDLNVQAVKFHDNLVNLTKGVNLDPILQVIKDLSDNFSVTTVEGQALKGLLTDVGKALGFGAKASQKPLQNLIDMAIIGAQNIEIATLRVSLQFKAWGVTLDSVTKKLDSIVSVLKNPVVGVLFGAPGIIGSAALRAIEKAKDEEKKNFDEFQKNQVSTPAFKRPGATLPEVNIAKAGENGRAAGEAMARGQKDGYAGLLEIHSPSKVFERFGRQSAEGLNKGWDAEAEIRIPAPTMRGGGPKQEVNNHLSAPVELHLHFPDAKDRNEIREAITGSETQAAFLKVLQDMAKSMGSPTDTPPGSTT